MEMYTYTRNKFSNYSVDQIATIITLNCYEESTYEDDRFVLHAKLDKQTNSMVIIQA